MASVWLELEPFFSCCSLSFFVTGAKPTIPSAIIVRWVDMAASVRLPSNECETLDATVLYCDEKYNVAKRLHCNGATREIWYRILMHGDSYTTIRKILWYIILLLLCVGQIRFTYP